VRSKKLFVPGQPSLSDRLPRLSLAHVRARAGGRLLCGPANPRHRAKCCRSDLTVGESTATGGPARKPPWVCGPSVPTGPKSPNPYCDKRETSVLTH